MVALEPVDRLFVEKIFQTDCARGVIPVVAKNFDVVLVLPHSVASPRFHMVTLRFRNTVDRVPRREIPNTHARRWLDSWQVSLYFEGKRGIVCHVWDASINTPAKFVEVRNDIEIPPRDGIYMKGVISVYQIYAPFLGHIFSMHRGIHCMNTARRVECISWMCEKRRDIRVCCHSIMHGVWRYPAIISDVRHVWVVSVSYTHLTLPTNREV